MALGATYKKFGGVAAPDFTSMIKGQQAVATGFKDAINGVEDLLKQTEEQHKNTNTLNVQQYLQDRIKAEGPGANPIDKTAIQKRFGSSIDMNKIDDTIKTETKNVFDNAVNKALGVAGQTFAKTENLADAGNALKQNLLDQGMKAADADKTASAWRNDHQYLAEDIKTSENIALEKAATAMYDDIRAGKGSFETVKNELVNQAAPKLRTRLVSKLNKTYADLSAMTPDQQDEYKAIEDQTHSYLAGVDQDIALSNAAAKAKYDAIHLVPESAKAGAMQLQGQLGGLGDAVSKNASNGWFKGLIRAMGDVFDGDAAKGDAVAAHLQANTEELINRGMSPDDAAGIAFQAYNIAKAKNSDNKIGTVINVADLDNIMNGYLGRYEDKQKELANYQNVMKVNAKKRALLNTQAIDMLARLRKGERFSNVSGKAYDSTAEFKKTIFGGGTLSPTTQLGKKTDTTKPDKTKTDTTKTDKNTGTTIDASDPKQIEARVQENRNRIAEAQSDAQAKENEGINAPQNTGGSTTLKGGKNAYNPPGSAFAGKDGGLVNWWNKRTNKANAKIESNYIKAATKKAGELGKLSTAKQNEYINKLKKAGENPLYIKTLKDTLDKNKTSSDTSKDKQFSNSVLQSLSKIPSTDKAVKKAAARLKLTQPKAEWAKVIALIKQGNPTLATKLAKELGLS